MRSYTGMWKSGMIRKGMEAKVISARWVVMPASTASWEYSGPRAWVISDSDFTTWVEERWTMVTRAPFSQRSALMSWAELFAPTTTHCRSAYASPLVNRLEWHCSPRKSAAPGKSGTLGMPDMPVASTSWRGRSVTGRPSRSTWTTHSPASSS